ncbi:fimbrial protein [Enterobacter sp. 118C5]|uniref:fimbrial protein n=1 Tax=Enterobacter TaxID=547 RepID=UPI002A7EC230|nr:fimbrial protein [Enterobacter sp. 118C5]
MYLRLAIILVPYLCMTHATVAAGQTLSGGSIHFYGAAVNAACAIDAQSLHQSIMMDQVKTGTFSAIGSWAAATPFSIKLENCDDTISQFTSVVFTGATDPRDPQVFMAGFGADAAKGVGLGIFDDKGHVITPNSTPLAKTALADGENNLLFTAKYRAVSSNIIAGDASAAVNFSVIYQ